MTVLPVAERVDGRAAEPGGQAAQVRCVGRGHRLDDDTPLLVSTVTTVEQFASSLIATATHMPQEITRCYLPSGRGDNPVSRAARLNWPRR